MTPFPTPDTALTHILIAADVARSRAWYVDVLGATLYREYGGSSVVLQFAGAWLLLTTSGPPTDDKPGVTLAPPADPDTRDNLFTIRVDDCRRRLRGAAPPRRRVPDPARDERRRDARVLPRSRRAPVRDQRVPRVTPRARLRAIRPFTKRIVNPVTRTFAGRLPGFALLTHVGRRSGRAYTTPINVFHRGGRYVFALTYGSEVDWVRNVRAAGGCEIVHAGASRPADRSPELIHDPSLRLMPLPVRLFLRPMRVTEVLRLRAGRS